MCGRYRRKSDKQRIAETFKLGVDLEELYPSPEDDIAQQSMRPVVIINQNGERQIELMRWAFKLPDRLLFVARSEGIERSRFWHDAFAKQRCIVPADSFFEWKDVPKGQKKPKYEFTVPDREPFGMAGLWKLWKNPTTELWERTFAIITGDVNAVTQPIHNRQPTILEPRDYAEYLSQTDTPPVHLLRVFDDEELKSQLLSEDDITQRQASLFDSL
jgi:putative SOS response-associated peptidase YedK